MSISKTYVNISKLKCRSVYSMLTLMEKKEGRKKGWKERRKERWKKTEVKSGGWREGKQVKDVIDLTKVTEN